MIYWLSRMLTSSENGYLDTFGSESNGRLTIWLNIHALITAKHLIQRNLMYPKT